MKQLTTSKFIEKAKQVHGDKYDYSKVFYRSGRQKVRIICNKHGEFLQSPCDHLSGYNCKGCGRDKISSFFQYNFKQFLEKAHKIHGDKYIYIEKTYTNSSSKISIICPLHGEFRQRANAHLSGQGCKKCMGDKISKIFKSNTEEFIQKAIEIHGNKCDYSKTDYINSWTKVCVTCLIDGHGDFWVTPNNHLNKKSGCPICNSSKGELTIKEILNKLNIKYIQEYIIPNQVYKFRYDFYLPDYNVLIEFHGIQHYEYNDFFHRNDEDNFLKQKERDIFKQELAKELKIPLLEFNYKQYKFLSGEQFEEMVIKKLKFPCDVRHA